jgi:hypothetical protein
MLVRQTCPGYTAALLLGSLLALVPAGAASILFVVGPPWKTGSSGRSSRDMKTMPTAYASAFFRVCGRDYVLPMTKGNLPRFPAIVIRLGKNS